MSESSSSTYSTSDGDTSVSSYSIDHHHSPSQEYTLPTNDECNIDLKKLRFIDPNIILSGSVDNGIEEYATQNRRKFSLFLLSYSFIDIKDIIWACTYMGSIASGTTIGLITCDSNINTDQWTINLLLLGGLMSSTFLSVLLRLGRIRVASLPTLILIGVSVALIFEKNLIPDIRVRRFIEFITGFATGLEFIFQQITVAESAVAPKRIILGVLNSTLLFGGFLIVQLFKASSLISSGVSSDFGGRYVLLLINVVLLLFHLAAAVHFFPETPRYLFFVQDQKTKCVRSLQWLRGKFVNIAEEYSDMTDGLTYLYGIPCQTNKRRLSDIITERVIALPLFSSVTLLLLSTLTGLQPICAYFNPGIPYEKTLVISGIMFLSSCVSALTASRLRIKSILLLSSAMSTLALLFGSFSLQLFSVSLDDSLLQMSILFFISSHSFGLGVLTWTVAFESFPVMGFELGASLGSSLWWAFILIFVMTHNQMDSIIGVRGVFWIHSLVGIITYIFILIAIPNVKRFDSLIKIQKRYLRFNLKM